MEKFVVAECETYKLIINNNFIDIRGYSPKHTTTDIRLELRLRLVNLDMISILNSEIPIMFDNEKFIICITKYYVYETVQEYTDEFIYLNVTLNIRNINDIYHGPKFIYI